MLRNTAGTKLAELSTLGNLFTPAKKLRGQIQKITPTKPWEWFMSDARIKFSGSEQGIFDDLPVHVPGA